MNMEKYVAVMCTLCTLLVAAIGLGQLYGQYGLVELRRGIERTESIQAVLGSTGEVFSHLLVTLQKAEALLTLSYQTTLRQRFAEAEEYARRASELLNTELTRIRALRATEQVYHGKDSPLLSVHGDFESATSEMLYAAYTAQAHAVFFMSDAEELRTIATKLKELRGDAWEAPHFYGAAAMMQESVTETDIQDAIEYYRQALESPTCSRYCVDRLNLAEAYLLLDKCTECATEVMRYREPFRSDHRPLPKSHELLAVWFECVAQYAQRPGAVAPLDTIKLESDRLHVDLRGQYESSALRQFGQRVRAGEAMDRLNQDQRSQIADAIDWLVTSASV
ncbi:MAG: hypothetical protein PVJ57_10485 [Phycisphaerae bacterium]|jgi:hypothetical protein